MEVPAPLPGSNLRSILHVDMDAFFVSVELLDRPELRGRPVVVGGTGSRGVVAAASYEARAYGVHSALATSVARRLCPNAVFLDGRHGRYREVSAQITAIFASVTPYVEPLSLDEAFLDVSGRLRSMGPAVEIAREVRRRVLDEVGVTCSVGVAHNKFLAKLATEQAKPRATPSGPVFGSGIAVVDPDAVEEFLWPLAAQALWGVGPATLAKLQRLGVVTVGDIARLPEEALVASVGSSAGRHLYALSHGLDDRPVVSDGEAKSISHEETFAADVYDRDRLDREILRLADAVTVRLRGAECFARTAHLKVRFSSFQTISRSVTVPEGLDDAGDLSRIVRSLLAGVDIAQGVRLIGVGLSGFVPAAERVVQLTLLDEVEPPSSPELNRAMDEIRERFGRTSIGPAALVEADPGRPSATRVFVEGQQQWGPSTPDV